MCWHQLAAEESIAQTITENFLRLMASVELYEDPYHVTENHVAALQPLTVSFYSYAIIFNSVFMLFPLAHFLSIAYFISLEE